MSFVATNEITNSYANMLRNGIMIDTGEKCEIHGTPLYRSRNSSIKTCLECWPSQMEKKNNEDVARRMKNAKKFHVTDVFQRESVINDELKNASFSNYQIVKNGYELDYQKPLNFAKRMEQHYFKGGKGNIIFTGSPGVGKSHLAISIIKQLLSDYESIGEPKTAIFIPVSRLMDKIKQSINGDSNFTREIAVELMISVDFLVLDEIGVENSESQWVQGILTDILDGRDKTIITTNLSSNELKRRYPLRLYDRILKGVKQDKTRGLEAQIFKFPDNMPSYRQNAF